MLKMETRNALICYGIIIIMGITSWYSHVAFMASMVITGVATITGLIMRLE